MPRSVSHPSKLTITLVVVLVLYINNSLQLTESSSSPPLHSRDTSTDGMATLPSLYSQFYGFKGPNSSLPSIRERKKEKERDQREEKRKEKKRWRRVSVSKLE